jgi:hypothetical protein
VEWGGGEEGGGGGLITIKRIHSVSQSILIVKSTPKVENPIPDIDAKVGLLRSYTFLVFAIHCEH